MRVPIEYAESFKLELLRVRALGSCDHLVSMLNFSFDFVFALISHDSQSVADDFQRQSCIFESLMGE